MGFGKIVDKNRTERARPKVAPGKNMLFAGQEASKPVLLIEMVPASAWAKNVRTMFPQEVWDAIRKQSYREARYRCEICSGRGPKWPVEGHEMWEYSERLQRQRLIKVVSLCPDCHAVKHWGWSRKNGKEVECLAHIKDVNGWDDHQFKRHYANVSEKWKRHSKIAWTTDLNVLITKYGIDRDIVQDVVLSQGKVIGGTKTAVRMAPEDRYCGPEEEPWIGDPSDYEGLF